MTSNTLPTVRVFTSWAGGTSYAAHSWRTLAPEYCPRGYGAPGEYCRDCPEVATDA